MAETPKANLSQPDSAFTWSTLLKRLSFAIECAGALYITCAIIAIVTLWRASSISILPLLGTLAAPAVAALIFVLVAILIPNLTRPGRLLFPLNVTLPFLYCAFLLVILILGPGSEPEILRLRDIMEWALIWARPGMILILLGSQIVFLSVLAWRGHHRPRPVE